MTVAPEQQAEIVEPGDNPLQLHPVDQTDRQWRFGFTNVVEEGVLQILCAVCRHFLSRIFFLNRLPFGTGFFPAAGPPLRSPSEGPAGAIRRQAWFLGKRVPGGGRAWRTEIVAQTSIREDLPDGFLVKRTLVRSMRSRAAPPACSKAHEIFRTPLERFFRFPGLSRSEQSGRAWQRSLTRQQK